MVNNPENIAYLIENTGWLIVSISAFNQAAKLKLAILLRYF